VRVPNSPFSFKTPFCCSNSFWWKHTLAASLERSAQNYFVFQIIFDMIQISRYLARCIAKTPPEIIRVCRKSLVLFVVVHVHIKRYNERYTPTINSLSRVLSTTHSKICERLFKYENVRHAFCTHCYVFCRSEGWQR
jgi:hypothetical protein